MRIAVRPQSLILTLPEHTKRRHFVRLSTSLRGFVPVIALAASAWSSAVPASADDHQTKPEGKKSAAIPVPCGDAAALVTAVSNANSAPGGGTVALATGCVYTLTSAAATGSDGPAGLPVITGTVTITGTRSTITRSPQAPDFRIAEVASGGSLTVGGVTVSGGRATTPPTGTDGGGILTLGTLNMAWATVTDNTASNNGGGIAVAPGGTTTLSLTKVAGNTAGDGGGIHVSTSARLTSNAGTISGNVASSTGGGLASYGTTLLSSPAIQGNRTTRFEGGGVLAGAGNLTVNGGGITGNTAGSYGGGVANFGSTLLMQDTTVSGNTATLDGGGLYGHAGTTHTTAGRVTRNTAGGGQGGGIFSDGGTVRLTATTVTGNNPNNCVPALAGCTG